MYYGGPPTAMDAILAIIANGRRAIVVIYREAGRNKLISYSLYKFILSLRLRPCPTPCEEAPVCGVYSSMETMPLDGKTAHHGGDVCVMCVLLAKSLPSVSFSFPPERT